MLNLIRLLAGRFAFRPLRVFHLFVLVTLITVAMPTQAAPDRGKMAGVMAALQLLFDSLEPPIPRPDGTAVKLGLNGLSNDAVPASSGNNVFVEFDLQRESTELCVHLTANRAFSSSEVTLELNGEPVSVRWGENCFQVLVSQQRDVNYLVLKVNAPGLTVSASSLELQSVNVSQLTLQRLLRSEWMTERYEKY